MSEQTINPEERQKEFFKEVNIGEQIHDNTQPPSATQKAEEFNPEIHCQNADGSPRRNRDGSFRKKPIQKGVKTEAVEAEVMPMDSFNEPPPTSTVQVVQMLVGLCALLAVKNFGDDWRLTAEEHNQLSEVYAKYMHYRGWDMENSPELVLFATTLAVLMPRIMSPNFVAMLRKKFGKKNNAHPDNRADGNGQNNTGENHNAASGGNGAGSDSVRPPIERMG
jgi:hypothetical protein